ncbi:MAG TPA: TIGR00725 family protein [Nocardioidaceae bacterium]|nr:TIGR00725 family protein [Nocardioidaceae bacterium]
MTGYVAVIGPGEPSDIDLLDLARTAGRLLAAQGYVVLTGGLGGVMAAAAEGASGGTTVALLPGSDRAAAHGDYSVVVPTGMGEMRNALLVRSADVVLAIGGAWGTLSEIALAVRTGVPVVAVRSWDLPEPVQAFDTVEEAVERIGYHL